MGRGPGEAARLGVRRSEQMQVACQPGCETGEAAQRLAELGPTSRAALGSSRAGVRAVVSVTGSAGKARAAGSVANKTGPAGRRGLPWNGPPPAPPGGRGGRAEG